MVTDTFIAYASGGAILLIFLLALIAFVPSWGQRNMAGYANSPFRGPGRGTQGLSHGRS